MKKTTLTEDARQTFFDEPDFAPHQLAVNQETALQDNSLPENAFLPDALLTLIKWTFLYMPGAAAIHFILMGLGLSFFYGDWFLELFLGMLGIFAASTFMIMFGIGKLSDLKYLKVVAGIFLTSALAAILYMTLAVLIPGDFFGFYAQITLPLPVIAGYLVKKNIDEEAEN